jgi:hypothetical protein
MNYLTRLLLGLGLAIPMSVWAAPFGPTPPEDDVYLNLSYYGMDGALYLEQSNGQCVKNMPYFLNLDGILLSVTCVASEKIGDSFKETYNKVIKMTGAGSTSESRWKPKNANPAQYQSTVLKLATNIDLNEFDADGKNCSETKAHDPLDFYGATLDGLNHTISNLCRADNGHMDQWFGLFSELAGKTVQNLTISNVDYKVTDKQPEYVPASNDAGDYQPAGALAPTIFNSTIKNIKLEKISIQAPLAGGLAGYIENSSIGRVFTTEGSNISITNDRQILNGYIGYTVYDNNYPNNTVFKGYRIVSGEQEQYKVLLGGLAGASMFTTFQDIDIAVQVKNNAEVAMSGLGGLVGHYVYARASEEPDVEFKNITIHGVDATTKFIVSGGTAMGGVLGASKRYVENNSIKVKLVFNNVLVNGLNMQNSKVYIKTPLVEPYGLYLGGIIGNSGLCGGGILQIMESTVENFSIEESLPGNYAFKYYIGGVAGYASCENTNNFDKSVAQGLTLKKTNANGSIKLDGGKSSGSGGKVGLINRVSATIGGLVGAAVLSLAEKAVSENNSRVSIDYSAKRVSSATDADTVLVGGVFGAASIFNTNTREVDLTDLSYQGTLSVVDDGVTTRIGGIIGTFPLFLTGDPRIAFSNDHVRAAGGTNLIEYTHTGGESDGTSLAMGGICGLCRSPREVSENTVEGSFVWKKAQEASAAPQKESNVGGLIGLVQANADVRNDKKNKYEIKNNSFVGNMSAAFNKGKGKAGYLVGTMIGDGLGNKPEIISNFHKGSDNFGAIGYFNNYGQYYNIKFFNEHEIDNEGNVLDNTLDKFVAKNNVRSGLVKDLQDGKNGSTMNGVVTEDYMKSEVFAAFLNLAWDDADRKWTFDKSVNDYPYIGKTSAEGGNPVSPEDINFEVKFVGLDAKGKEKTETQQVKYGENAVLPKSKDFPAAVDGKCFDAWDGDYTNVTSDMTITAQYVTCTYTVKFANEDGTKTFKTEEVEYSKGATAPTDLDLPDGLCLDHWVGSFDNVKSDLTIKAKTMSCGKSSSSSSENISVSSSSCSAGNSEISSSSSSSSKGDKSSSSIKGKSSSSSAKSSSSSSAGKGKSSSSKNNQYEIAKPTVQQDGDALRMVFDNALAESFEKVRIQVESDAGIYLDTTIKRKYVEKAKNGTSRLDPAPVGDYTVTFTLIDGDKVSSYDEKITNKKTTKEYISHAWQTLSLNAFCYNKGDECLSELEARFARVQSDWAKEECRHMQDEIKRGMNDDQFYQEMLDVCAQANGSGAVTSVYWWDETNPVGDFWQYRKFSVKDKFEPTRGYWYGPDEQEPPKMSLQTPNMNDTIVWKLENKYSGWNLVANPYGWYVKLPKDENVDFCQWNPETSGYVVPEVLGPYEALWVHTKKSMTYRIPLKASIVLEGEKKALSKSAVSESWNLRVVLADDNGKRDSWNEIAAGRIAKTLSEPPAGMGDHVNLSIVEGKNRLAKSVKTNADDLEWDLEVSATTTRAGHLSFEGLESVWAKGMHVYATVDNETVEVVKDSPVDVKLSSKAKNVSVRVTKGAKPVNIAKGLLKGLHVGQASNVLNVGFDAASKLAGANVKVSIVGVDGRIVATNRAVAREGSNAVSMKKPKQGVYFVKVKVEPAPHPNPPLHPLRPHGPFGG